jgi:hypothetical protein
MHTGVRRALLAILALGSLAAAFFIKPIPQDPRYHEFADQRTLLGIPHFMDVASNLPFLVAGVVALYNLQTRKDIYYPVPEARPAWVILAFAVLFTAFGSAVYHLAPRDGTLFIDRLPMAIGFSVVLAIMVLEWVDPSPRGRMIAGGILLAGFGSLAYAFWSQDLRFYFLLQGWAIVFVPLIVALFPAPARGTSNLVLGIAAYGVAKVFEFFDGPIFRLTGVLSGHTLKHLAAALGSWYLFVYLFRRRPI